MPTNDPSDGALRRAFVGDVHGCFNELLELLDSIGFDPVAASVDDAVDEVWFVGDLVNGGPRSDAVLALADRIIQDKRGGFVVGNHDDSLLCALEGKGALSGPVAESLRQIDTGGAITRDRARAMLEAAPLDVRFDDIGVLLVHAAPVDPGDSLERQRETAIYGPTADGRDDQGKLLRINWPRDYDGSAFVVFGHSPHRAPARFARAICLDTGCVYGGSLTAYLPHEDRCVSVRAKQSHREGRLREGASTGPYL